MKSWKIILFLLFVGVLFPAVFSQNSFLKLQKVKAQFRAPYVTRELCGWDRVGYQCKCKRFFGSNYYCCVRGNCTVITRSCGGCGGGTWMPIDAGGGPVPVFIPGTKKLKKCEYILRNKCDRGVYARDRYGPKARIYSSVCHYISRVNSWSSCDGSKKVARSVTWSTKRGTSCSHTRLVQSCFHGRCGRANGGAYSGLNSSSRGLCSRGRVSNLHINNYRYRWTCKGNNSRIDDQCSAYQRINGQCSSRSFTNINQAGCSAGSRRSLGGAGTLGNPWHWVCEGIGPGHANASCQGWHTPEINFPDPRIIDPVPSGSSLEGNPLHINNGETVHFEWTTQYAVSCQGRGGNNQWRTGVNGINNSLDVPVTNRIDRQYNFRLECSNPGGSQSSSKTISLHGNPVVRLSSTPNPVEISGGAQGIPADDLRYNRLTPPVSFQLFWQGDNLARRNDACRVLGPEDGAIRNFTNWQLGQDKSDMGNGVVIVPESTGSIIFNLNCRNTHPTRARWSNGSCTAQMSGAGGNENTNNLCSDGKDNDGDGLIDCQDEDCYQSNINVCLWKDLSKIGLEVDVRCAEEASAWSTCSEECGGGVRTRQSTDAYTCQRNLSQKESCNNEDCGSGWKEVN